MITRDWLVLCGIIDSISVNFEKMAERSVTRRKPAKVIKTNVIILLEVDFGIGLKAENGVNDIKVLSGVRRSED